jgi:hypothetical protein
MLGLSISTKTLIYISVGVIVVGILVIYTIRNNKRINNEIKEMKEVMMKQHKYNENNFLEISNVFKNIEMKENVIRKENIIRKENAKPITKLNKENLEKINTIEENDLINSIHRNNIVLTTIYETSIPTKEKTEIQIIDEDKVLEEAENLLNNKECDDDVCNVLLDKEINESKEIVYDKEDKNEDIEETINIPIKQSKKKVKKEI